MSYLGLMLLIGYALFQMRQSRKWEAEYYARLKADEDHKQPLDERAARRVNMSIDDYRFFQMLERSSI